MGDTGDTKNNLIKQIFQTMEYGNDSENIGEFTEWLKTKENRIFAYVDKQDEQPNGEVLSIENANSEEKLCDIHVPDNATIETILKKVAGAKNKWIEIPAVKRSEIIYKWGAEIQKQQNLFIQLEIAARGILSKDTKTKALPLLTDFLQYYASFCAKNIAESSSNSKGLTIGIIPDNNNLSAFGCMLGPCLASGNNVVLQTGPQLSLVATLLIELAIQVGVPEGTIRLIPGNIDPNVFFLHPDVSTIFIFDDLHKEKYLIANHFHKKLLHFGSTGTSMIVFDNCDLDSACHSVAGAAWSYKGMVPWSVRNIFVQENVFEKFVHKLKHELNQIKVGKSDKKNVDVSYPEETVLDKMKTVIQKAKSEGVEVYQLKTENIIPTLLIGGNIFPNNVIKEDFLNVPVVTLVAFRTINEAVSLANNTRQGLGVSVWTESTSLVNEIIGKLKVGNIWVNSHGLFAANIAISPFKTSGNAFFGGNEGFCEYFRTKTVKNETSTKVQNGDAMEKALGEAKKSQDGWSKLSHFERVKHLQLAVLNLQGDKNWGLPEKWVEDWITLTYDYASSHSVENFYKFKNFNVVATREPCGILAVETSEDKEFHNKRLIIAAVLEGNAVIILNDCKQATSFYSSLCTLLPKGVLTAIPHSQDAIKVAALHKELNVYIGETNNKVFGSLPLKTSNKFKVANSDKWDEVRNKVGLAKNIWFNKGQSFM